MSSLRDEIREAREESRKDFRRVHARIDELQANVQALQQDRAWMRGFWKAASLGLGALGVALGWLLKRVWPAVLVLFTSCAPGPYGAHSKWPPALYPVTLLVDLSMPAECLDSADQGFDFWLPRATYLNRLEIKSPSAPHLGEIRMRFGPRPAGTKDDVLANTHKVHTPAVGEVPGRILTADIALYACDPGTVAHEIGHALGLEHRHDLGALMHPGLIQGGWDLELEELRWVREVK